MLTITECLRGWLLGCAVVVMAGEAFAEVKVAATIAPMHSLVSMVMDGVSEPALIVRPGGSPHDYAMKPSEARALDQADLVFWVGSHLEPWMGKVIQTLAADARLVELGAVPGLTRFGVREGGIWARHEDHGHDDHDHEEQSHHADADDLARYDPHLWLDPDNALIWLEVIAAELTDIDPDHAAAYRANAERAVGRLASVTASAEKALAPARGKPYIVFHDAYQYFERRFGLLALGSVSLSDADRPSALRLTEIRQRIQESGAICAFAEPQFEPKLLDMVIAGQDIAKAILDPMGADLEPGIDFYPALIERIVLSLTDCLS